MIYPFRKIENVAVMISRSRDGEYVVRAAERPAELIRFMTEGEPGKFCATPMDGPGAPREN